MIDHEFVRKINEGKCFVLVGSGPSCQMGYPSWHRLAELTFKKLQEQGLVHNNKSYEVYLKQRKYPELFRLAEKEIGGREKLLVLLREFLVPSADGQDTIYRILSKWPFACYLTTNYDDELKHHLDSTGVSYSVIQNRKVDFANIRNGASHLIQKLHSDYEHPEQLVLTSDDYQKFYIYDEYRYFREKLSQTLQMFDFLIIGHSLSDPDIQYVLQLAKQYASPIHPIYMLGPNYTDAEKLEYFEKYNIVLSSYEDKDNKHSQLRRILSIADRFIIPRKNIISSHPISHVPEEVNAALSLSIFRRLQTIRSSDNIEPLVLVALSSIKGEKIQAQKLVELTPLKEICRQGTGVAELVAENLDKLVSLGLVTSEGAEYSITESGSDRMQDYSSVRDTEKKQAFGQFILDLRNNHRSIKKDQEELCSNLAETVLVRAFKNRGLTIANRVFVGRSASSAELSDIFKEITLAASAIVNFELRAAFIEAMHAFVISPNDPQKKFLASVSQGYFLYHLLGLDPTCIKVRRNIVENTVWICDSSVILPLIAWGCHNNEYAVSLFHILDKVKSVYFTTPKLLQEAWEHFKWAIDFVKQHGFESPEFIQAAIVKGGYKQNLFIDGFVRLSAEGRVGTFSEYIAQISPKGRDRTSFENRIKNLGIRLLDLSELKGFEPITWSDLEDIKSKIRDEREKKGTYHNELQVESEAEVRILITNLRSGKLSLPDNLKSPERFYFISLSRILDRVFQSTTITTWTPEAIYRYLSALPEEQINPDLLQQCMLHEYFYAGISFIDKERYLRFFGPSIDAAKASYAEERGKYVEYIEDGTIKQYDDAFDKTPDMEKPFFVQQMVWKIAEASKRAEEMAKQRAIDAETRVKRLESQVDATLVQKAKIREEQEAAHQRNLRDPKYLRKLHRQQKKAKRKNR